VPTANAPLHIAEELSKSAALRGQITVQAVSVAGLADNVAAA